MYSEDELDEAVSAGIVPAPIAEAFRAHVSRRRDAPAADEEQFRLVTSFNDIFVTIALVLLFVSLGQIALLFGVNSVTILITAISWGLAEFFTRRRRMALPSIVLLFAFVGSAAATTLLLAEKIVPVQENSRVEAILAAIAAAGAVAAAWLHWRRFMVPITVAAGAAALTGLAVALFAAVFPAATHALWLIAFIAGLAVFALAMRWDLSDRERRTRRADVAFWLHLAAAPLIAHPIFYVLGVFSGELVPVTALAILMMYVAFGAVALAIDRRALLVSGLAYVIYAMYVLLERVGVVAMSTAFTALVIGSALLLLSAFWQQMRRVVVAQLGPLAGRLPPTA